MSSALLKIKTKDDVFFVSLNRPEKRNALNPPLIKALLSFFQKPGWGSSTRAIVLSGEGPAFCSGADLQAIKNPSVFSKKDLGNLFSLLQCIEASPLPVIAMAKGFAVGGGLGLLSVADIVIAEKGTVFRFSETKLGLVPSIISPFVLKKMGVSWSKFFMLSAKVFLAQEGRDKGLVHFVGTKKECAVFLKDMLNSIKGLDPLALLETKNWLNELSHQGKGLVFTSDIKQKAVGLIHESRKRPTTKKRIK